MSFLPDDAARADHLPQPATVQPATVPATTAQSAHLQVTKGHGTRNDFVLIDDRNDELDLTVELVKTLANRHSGVGGDGVIRLAPTASIDAALTIARPDARWFMDYRNADGSIAQMCGNGVRVFAAFVEDLGLHDFAVPLVLGTRAGVKSVVKETHGWYAVDMGPGLFSGVTNAAGNLEFTGDSSTHSDSLVVTAGLGTQPRAALSVDMGNPHTVVALADRAELDAADLTRTPTVTPVPPHGTNVEFVVPLGETSDGIGRAVMRVHERGVGETQSCGTGACAVALALRAWGGEDSPKVWLIDVPGGTVRVTALDNGHVELAGPAVLVARASVDLVALG